jgi:hypothetical protein
VGFSWVQDIPVQRPAIPRARRDRSRYPSRHGRGSTIRRLIIWRPQPRSAPTATPPPGPGRRLTRRWPAVRGHARQAARRSSSERTAPAIASSRNVRTGKARRPGLPALLGTPADRGPTPITRLIHLPPPVVPLQDPDSRSYTILIAHHVNLLSRLGRSCGHQAPPPGPELICGAGRYHRTGRRSAPATDSAGSRAGRTTQVPSACPPPIQSGRPPARYRPGPDARPAIKDRSKHF